MLSATEEQEQAARAALAELTRQAEPVQAALQAAEIAYGVAAGDVRGLTDVSGAAGWTFETSRMSWHTAAERVSQDVRVAAARQIAGASLIGDVLRPIGVSA